MSSPLPKMSPAEEAAPAGSPKEASPAHSDTELEPVNTASNEAHVCPLCNETYKQPRVLSCLHVFCTSCLEKQLEESDDELEAGDSASAGKPITEGGTLRCMQCHQDTLLPPKGVVDLPQDSVLMGQMNTNGLEDMQIVCTSCKAREKAVARCMDCANFLCPNCVTAHQYMRCFENHKVVSFEDLQNGEELTLHKPVFCPTHTSETMKLFCKRCQEPLCPDCVPTEHPPQEHPVHRVVDIEASEREHLQSLMAEARGKLEFCRQAQGQLENAQMELQMQRDNASGLIKETFQSYKVILEKRQEALLKELSEVHSEQRSHIWDLTHQVEKTLEKIEDGCGFVERVLHHGSSVEMLGMKKLMEDQLLSLINNTPAMDVKVQLQFTSDSEKFASAMETHFGVLNEETKKQETEKQNPLVSSIQSSMEPESLMLPADMLADPMLPPVTSPDFLQSLQLASPLSMPPNMAPLSGMGPDLMTNIPGLTSGPAMTSDKSSSRNSYSPAMSDSGISLDAGSSGTACLPSPPQPPVNVMALTKLGTVNINGQGHITLNGQTIPGLNVSNVTGLPQALTGRAHNSATSSTDALASLLTSMSSASVRSPTPQMNQIGDLLNQANQQLNSIAAANASSGAASPSIMPHLTPPLPGMNSLGGMTSPPPVTPPTPSNFLSNLGLNLGQSPIPRTGKLGPMQIRCKFGQLGPGKGQFNSPHGFCLGMDEDIVVADTNNHRIQVFEKTGEFKYQFGIPGREEGQLWYPRKVAVIQHSGKYVVCDRGNERSRMQIFTKSGHFIKKIAIRYIDIVAGLAISSQGHIVAVDSVSPTVFCIAETGDLIKWFDCANYMREPSDIAVNGKEYYVCDFKGHCVVVFNEEGVFMRRIGCENITNFPNGIDISDAGDVLVGDSHGNRFHVAVFQREGSLIGEFECPYVKVSRCCGLKITAEGYIVTLAKNNHHVLVLNTLYIV